MGCRFPQAESVEEYWSNLVGNRDCVTPVPRERFDIESVYAPQPGTPGRTVSRHGGFLNDPFAFDPGFFEISPAEAASMDPQHRLLLPVVREALEGAGILPSALARTATGVYIGQATADYAHENHVETHDLREATGSHIRAMGSGRVSYDLDLRGPSLTVDTACSSSLVAVHMARQGLLTGETDLAIAAWGQPHPVAARRRGLLAGGDALAGGALQVRGQRRQRLRAQRGRRRSGAGSVMRRRSGRIPRPGAAPGKRGHQRRA